jgi:DNA-binding transcriptional regulator GbsR (MarR family)
MQTSSGAGSVAGLSPLAAREVIAPVAGSDPVAQAASGLCLPNFHGFLKIQINLSAMDALTPLVRSFVAHFGEMGSRWGINRTVGQIYALIFVSPQPLNADEIAEKLEFSRSNVSMGLKELQAWRLVNLRHLPGDRREYFDAPSDAWEIFRTLAEERRRREIEPTLSMLRNALLETPRTEEDRVALERMRGMHDLIELTTTWFDDVQQMDRQTLSKLMKMGAKVQKVLQFTGKMTAAAGGKH